MALLSGLNNVAMAIWRRHRDLRLEPRWAAALEKACRTGGDPALATSMIRSAWQRDRHPLVGLAYSQNVVMTSQHVDEAVPILVDVLQLQLNSWMRMQALAYYALALVALNRVHEAPAAIGECRRLAHLHRHKYILTLLQVCDVEVLSQRGDPTWKHEQAVLQAMPYYRYVKALAAAHTPVPQKSHPTGD